MQVLGYCFRYAILSNRIIGFLIDNQSVRLEGLSRTLVARPVNANMNTLEGKQRFICCSQMSVPSLLGLDIF